jgi:predicted GNAT family acetyltransferase
MSHYADYIKERLGKHIIEDERGFATYSFTDESTVYIEDIYITPEHRKSGVATSFADKIVAIAKAKGCTRLLGSVAPSANGSTDSLKCFLAYGCSLESSTNNFIVLVKRI